MGDNALQISRFVLLLSRVTTQLVKLRSFLGTHYGACQVALDNGNIFIAGGRGTDLNEDMNKGIALVVFYRQSTNNTDSSPSNFSIPV